MNSRAKRGRRRTRCVPRCGQFDGVTSNENDRRNNHRSRRCQKPPVAKFSPRTTRLNELIALPRGRYPKVSLEFSPTKSDLRKTRRTIGVAVCTRRLVSPKTSFAFHRRTEHYHRDADFCALKHKYMCIH